MPMIEGRESTAGVRSPFHIVHLTAEYWPLAQTGGLAEAVVGLANAQSTAGFPVTVLLPLYQTVRSKGVPLEPCGEPFDIDVGTEVHQAQLYRLETGNAGPRVHLIGNDHFFNRAGIYGEGGRDYLDSAQRFLFFSRAALESLPMLTQGARALLHAHDWHTALGPALLRTQYAGRPQYGGVAATVTVHNGAFQGHFPIQVGEELGLFDLPGGEHYEWRGGVNFLKAGMCYADNVTTVSPAHADELRTPIGGFGLDPIFAGLGTRLVGILNGFDPVRWDPATDPVITTNYDASNMTGKRDCKVALQRQFDLPVDAEVPLTVMSARLVSQKGLDLILSPDCHAMAHGQYIFLGRGDRHYERALTELAGAAPSRIAVPLRFSDKEEHQLLAGADILLMPSLFEPCGLTQLRAMRYGTVPVVRRVGGLANSIAHDKTGFLFDQYTPIALGDVMSHAQARYHDQTEWKSLMVNGMVSDFRWANSAAKYTDVYRSALRRVRHGLGTEPAAPVQARTQPALARRAYR